MRTEKYKAACLILLALAMSAASGSVSSASAAPHRSRHANHGQTFYYRAPVAANDVRRESNASVYANDPWLWSQGRE
jgi:hypothetical protein